MNRRTFLETASAGLALRLRARATEGPQTPQAPVPYAPDSPGGKYATFLANLTKDVEAAEALRKPTDSPSEWVKCMDATDALEARLLPLKNSFDRLPKGDKRAFKQQRSNLEKRVKRLQE